MSVPIAAGSTRFQEAMGYLASFTDWEQMLHRAPERTTFDLGRMRRLLDRFGDPHRGRRVIHVTGTKGKTTCTYAADAVLRAHGVRTFRFVSPHVERVQERLAIGGDEIGDDAFADLVSGLKPTLAAIGAQEPGDMPSFFEVMTLLGFLWAREREVPALVLEVGLGGRLDATNVVESSVAVITSIGLDHVRILGSSREAIAGEKAGIIKPGCAAITALRPGDRAFDVLAARATEMGATLIRPGMGVQVTACREVIREDGGPGLVFDGHVGELRLDSMTLRAGAAHQAWNAVLAAAAARLLLAQLGQDLDLARTRAALGALQVPARAEWFPGEPPVLLDGAHTVESIADLVGVAQRLAAGRALHLVCGLTRDRDPGALFGPIATHVASITATALPTPRTLGPRELLDGATNGTARLATAPDPAAALDTAIANAGSEGVVVVAGSLYLAGALRPLLVARGAR